MNIAVVYFSSATKSEIMRTSNNAFSIDLIALVNSVQVADDSLDSLFAEVEKSGQIPKSSQPTTGDIIECYNKVNEVFDHVIVCTPSKYLSGTHQNAILAIDLLENKKAEFHIVETKSFALSEFIIATKALEMIEENKDIEVILENLEYIADNLHTYISPGGLEYLKYSGRVSGTTALVGKLLDLKVLLEYIEPKEDIEKNSANVVSKGRGFKSTLKELNKIFTDTAVKEFYFTSINVDEDIKNQVFLLAEKNGINLQDAGIASNIMGVHFGPQSFGILTIK